MASTDTGSPDITHDMMMLMLQLGVIIFAAQLGRMIFQRLKLPGMLGELCSGLIIGPFALGAVSLPFLAHGLFPPGPDLAVSHELYGICQVAAIVLLFMVGLETDLTLFLRFSIEGSLVGIGGVLLSFAAGDFATMLFSHLTFGVSLGFFDAPCLFLGVISTATSVGITARILSDQHKLDTPEGATILSGAVIDDVLGIIMLALVGGLAMSSGGSGVDWRHVGIIAVKAIGIWLIATGLGIWLSHRISRLLKALRDRAAIAVSAFGLALLMAGLFEQAGLAMIIGAYVAGLSLSQTDISRVIQEKLEPVQRLMVPVFFCVMGMLVDLRAMTSWPVLLFGTGYTLAALFSKLLGCGIPAFLLRFNARGALRIGLGMVPRGEVAIIIAGVGIAGGMLNGETFGVAIMMTLLTTLLAPVLLMRLFSNPASGTRHPTPPSGEIFLNFDMPSAEIAELMQGKLIDAFEHEGFFVHVIEHHAGGACFMLKNTMSIQLRREKATLRFTSHAEEAPIIHAAIYEVAAELHRMIEGLKKPLDEKAIGRQFQAAIPKVPAKSKAGLELADYLRADAMIPQLEGHTKQAIIEELLDRLVRLGLVSDRDQALEALHEREKTGPTCMQHGIAIPHARTTAVEHIVCAVGVKPSGIDCESLDGLPSTIFILELAPQDAAGPHLQFMSTISRNLDEATRAVLLTPGVSPEEIHRALVTPNT